MIKKLLIGTHLSVILLAFTACTESKKVETDTASMETVEKKVGDASSKKCQADGKCGEGKCGDSPKTSK